VKINHVAQTKLNQLVEENVHMITNQPGGKAYLSDIKVTNISKSFTHKIVAKTSWHEYGTKLRHCHPMYIRLRKSYTLGSGGGGDRAAG